MIKKLKQLTNFSDFFFYNSVFQKKKKFYQLKFNYKINNVHIIGRSSFLIHFKNEAKNFTSRVFLNKKTNYKKNDIIFSINNPTIISKNILEKTICINYHDSYLPYFKGLNSSTWAIIKNSKFHGCTFHLVDSGIDTGPIIYQKKIKILTNYTSRDLDILNIKNSFILYKRILNDIFLKKKILITKFNKKGNYFSRKDILKIKLCGFIDLKWKFAKIMKYFNALTVSDQKKSFILTPKLLSNNNRIYEIEDIKNIKYTSFICTSQNGFYNLINNKIYLKEGNRTLEILLKKKLKKIKLASSNQIKKYVKDNKNDFNLR